MNKVHETLKKHILIDDEAVVIDLEKSEGSWLADTSGKTYLDCFSQFASQPLGWNHPKVLAQKDRLLKAAIHKVANSDMYTQEFADFVETFAGFTSDFKYHFYISGGALAVENALKVAFDWKYRTPCSVAMASEDAMDVLHLRNAFHGRSGYTLSLTNTGQQKIKHFPKFKWNRVKPPTIHFPLNAIRMNNLTAIALQEIERKISPLTAAILIEPIQGEGGDNHFTQSFFTGLRKIADKKECLLIFDEVQTGVGLTGKMWAYEHYGVVPDIIAFGKKMQVCGICSTDRVDSVEDNVFHEPSRINSTWGGNLVDMVRATIFLEIIKEDNLIENSAEVGEYFLSLLRKLNLPNARGRGLMIAFDLDDEKERDAVLKKLNETMLVLPCGEKSIRFRPHLTFSKEEVDIAVEMIIKAL